MVWYYREKDQEIGPVSKNELQNLVKSKQISAETLVRSVEMTEWTPLIDVVRGKIGQPEAAPPPQVEPEAVSQPPEATADDDFGALAMEDQDENTLVQGQDLNVAESVEESHLATCSQCGGSFPEDQVIPFENRMICATCKPTFLQQLKEGVATPLSVAYGGFWIRVLATIIDVFLYSIVTQIMMIPISMLMVPAAATIGEDGAMGGMIMIIVLSLIIGLGVPMIYYTIFHGRWGATVGKMACGLRVVTAEGEPITYGRAFGRFWGYMLSSFILHIGNIMAGFDDEKRTLHDRMCSTRVIKNR